MGGVRVATSVDGAPVPIFCFALGRVEGGDARRDLEGHGGSAILFDRTFRLRAG